MDCLHLSQHCMDGTRESNQRRCLSLIAGIRVMLEWEVQRSRF